MIKEWTEKVGTMKNDFFMVLTFSLIWKIHFKNNSSCSGVQSQILPDSS